MLSHDDVTRKIKCIIITENLIQIFKLRSKNKNDEVNLIIIPPSTISTLLYKFKK